MCPAERAPDVRSQPRIDAGGVEGVIARGKEANELAITKLAKAHGAFSVAAAAGDIRFHGNRVNGGLIDSDGANAPHVVICHGTVRR